MVLAARCQRADTCQHSGSIRSLYKMEISSSLQEAVHVNLSQK